MSNTASLSGESNFWRMAWTADSTPAIWPTHSWVVLAESSTSSFMAEITALAMMQQAVSLIPMGLTPGFLSRAIRRHASKGAIHFGSIRVVHKRLATSAREWQRLSEAALKDVQSRLQVYASKPEGPAAPLVLKAMDLNRVASIASKVVGWTSGGTPGLSNSWWTGLLCGCLLLRTSLTEVFSPLRSWRWRTPPLPLSQSNCRAAYVLPWNISLAKERATCSLLVWWR